MIGYDDPWIAPCGKAFGDWFSMTNHRKECGECAEILFFDFGISQRCCHEECDIDDRGICYERD